MKNKLRKMKGGLAAIVAILALVFVSIAGFSTPAMAVGNLTNNGIVSAAIAYSNGQYGGQCKQWVDDVVNTASGGTVHLSGYQQGFANAGATQVSSSNAVAGDIIQITPAGSTDATAVSLFNINNSADQLHTAIILGNNGGGNFSVIDSDSYGYTNEVDRHSFDPYTSMSGSIIDIWRLGTVSNTWGGVGSATYAGSSNLVSGQSLAPGDYLESSNGYYVLMMQTDGNLVAYGHAGAIWSSHTSSPGSHLLVQPDGNAVIYSSSNVAQWSTGTNSITSFVMQGDGNVVGLNSSNTATWSTGTTNTDGSGMSYAGTDQVDTSQTLTTGHYLRSIDGRYFLAMQLDGNMVLYGPGYHVLWSSGTSGYPNAYLIDQGDGNVVIYSASGGTAIWYVGSNITKFQIQSDGNGVGYTASNIAAWSTGTGGQI